jgi:four helix bundle protein
MRTSDNAELLKMSLNYAMKVIDFSDELEEARKNVIAQKLLEAGFGISSSLYQARKATRKSDFDFSMSRAVKNTKETLYWLNQCLNSTNYPKNPELKAMGEMLQKNIINLLTGKTINEELPS